jgi:ERCC4-type nuclease
MKLVIDSREPEKFYTEIKNNLNQEINIEIVRDNLDVGDFHIYKNNKDLPDFIIERKSINDLLSSIKDGRYNEQSFRLNNFPIHNHNIYYLIEGSIEYIKNEQNKRIVYSSIFTISHFKGFSILNTFNINHSINLIIKFIEKLFKEDKKISYYNNSENQIEADYSQVIKSSKKANITKENILEIMLMQIPNISKSIAYLVSKEFKTLKNLIENIEKNPNCLDNLKYEGDNKRKISKTAISNIKKFLLL